MTILIRADIAPIIAALLIGIATGWWMFRHLRHAPRKAQGPEQQ